MTVRYATKLTGTAGDDSVDQIDGAILSVNDITICPCVDDDKFYVYKVDESGAAESSSDVIAPNTNAGNKRHKVMGIYDAAGVFATRVAVVKCIADDTVLTVADALASFTIPIELNGMNLVSVGAHVYTASSSGLPTFEIYNLTNTAQMLSTLLTIDATEKDSKDATTAAVIDTNNDDVVTGDELQFNCTIAGTGTKGMEIRMGFRLP